jgi:hypothetical protein
MSARRGDCDDPCIQRLRNDIIEIVRQIGLTDPQQQANMKFFNLDIMLNEMLQEAFTGNTRARDAFQAEMERLQRLGMIAEEQASQYRERARLIEEIALRFQNPHLTLAQLRSAITTLDGLILNDQWDEVIDTIERQGYVSGLGAEWETIKATLRQQAAAARQAVVTSYSYLKDNAYPMFCWLMAFLCMLPRACRDCLREALGPDYSYLFDMLLSDPSCTYWKAKVAGFMYQGYQDLTPEQIDNATWALFGGLNNMSQICANVCFKLLGAFNIIQRFAGGIFLNGISNLSSYLNVAGLPANLRVFDESQSIKSEQSRSTSNSASSTKSFITATGEIDFDGVRAEIAEIMERRSAEGYITMNSQEGSREVENVSDDDDGMQPMIYDNTGYNEMFSETQTDEMTPGGPNRVRLMDPRGNAVLGTKTKLSPGERLLMIQQQANKVKTGAKTTDDWLRKNKEKMYKKTGSLMDKRSNSLGGRKSRRYKKKRSTLKRRGLKRRRTRKGKKRRHTKKR